MASYHKYMYMYIHAPFRDPPQGMVQGSAAIGIFHLQQVLPAAAHKYPTHLPVSGQY